MQLPVLLATNKLNYVVLFLAFVFIGNVRSIPNDASKPQQLENKTPVLVLEQKSVKKELKVKLPDEAIVDITPSQEKDHSQKMNVIDEKPVTEKTGKGLVQEIVQNIDVKAGIFETTTKLKPLEPQHHQHILDEDFVLNDEDDISESLKTGFYFFLILSSGAIGFIIFKIYRLRLSRAERKYGVQGDRSTQELTPLPTSIEDGQSDDEDQTLFEVQRQNIRIL